MSVGIHHFSFITLLLLLIIDYNKIYCLTDGDDKNVEGSYPHSCAISDTLVFFITSAGSFIFDNNLLPVVNQDSIKSSFSSDLVCYNNTHFFLVGSESSLIITLITITNNNIISGRQTNLTYVIDNFHTFSARLIGSSKILISWYSNNSLFIKIYKINESNDLTLDREKTIPCIGCSDITCENKSGKLLCIYLDNSKAIYYIINEDLTGSPSTSVIFTDSMVNIKDYKFLKLEVDNKFIFCFERLLMSTYIYCSMLDFANNDNSIEMQNDYELVNGSVYLSSISEGLKHAVYVIVINSNMYQLFKLSTFTGITSSRTIVGQGGFNNSTVFPIENDFIVVGCTTSLNRTKLFPILYPMCEDVKVYVTLGTSPQFDLISNVYTHNEGQNNNTLQIIFEILPTNAGIQNNNIFIQTLNKYKRDDEFIITMTSLEPLSEIGYYYTYANEQLTSFSCDLDITVCYSTCETCSNPGGNINNHYCDKCLTGYYKVNGTSNCFKEPPEGYYTDGSLIYKCFETCSECNGQGNENNHNCMTCKISEGFYKVEGESGMCKNLSNNSSYYLDPNEGMYKKCHESCKGCSSSQSGSKTNCIECKEGYQPYPDDSTQCTKKCDYKWTLDSTTQMITCLDSSSDCDLKDQGNNNYILVQDTNQCVSSCVNYYDKNCILCRTTRLFLFSYDNKYYCYEHCNEIPFGNYTENYEFNTCDKLDPGNETVVINGTDKLVYRSLSVSTLFKDYNLNSLAIQTYLNIIRTEQANGDRIGLTLRVKGGDFNTTIYKYSNRDAFPLFDVIGHVNLDALYQSLISQGVINENEDILVGQVDALREDEPTNQIEYKVFITTGNEIDISSFTSVNTTIEYPIRMEYKLDTIDMITEMQNKSINVYNISEPFYNDICFIFTSNTSRDVTIEDRRKYYYPLDNLCEENCDLISFDNDTHKVKCECILKTSYSSIIKPNTKNEPLPNKFVSNINAIKCYDTVFDTDNFFDNLPFWVFGILLFIQLAILIWSCCSGTSFIKKYLETNYQYKEEKPEEVENAINLKNENFILSSQAKSKQAPLQTVYRTNETKGKKKKTYTNLPNPPHMNNNEKDFMNNNNHNDETINVNNENEVTNVNNENDITNANNDKPFEEDSIDDFKVNELALFEFDPLNNNYVRNDEVQKEEENKNSFITGMNKPSLKSMLTSFNKNAPTINPNNYSVNDIEKGEDKNSKVHDNCYTDSNSNKDKVKFGMAEEDQGNEMGNTPLDKKNRKKKKRLNLDEEEEEEEDDEIIKKPKKRKYSKILIDHDDSSSNNNHILILKNQKIQTPMNFKSDSDKLISEREQLTPNSLILSKKKDPNASSGDIEKKSVSSENGLNSKRSSIQHEDIIIHNATQGGKPTKKEKKYSCFKDFCLYFTKREVLLLAITNRKEYFPSFALWGMVILAMNILFGVHCIFFKADNVSKRFHLFGESASFSFLIDNELMKCIISALICNAVKIILIKLLIFLLFKPNKKKLVNKENYQSLISLTRCKLIFFFIVVFLLTCGVFYVNACYGGVFINSKSALFLGFATTYIISFIVCLVLCLIINIIRGMGECCNCCCFQTIYKVLKFLY